MSALSHEASDAAAIEEIRAIGSLGDAGSDVVFKEVLLGSDGDNVRTGVPLLKGAKVQAAGDRTTLKKKKLLQALRPGEKPKTTDKTTKVTSIKKKPEKAAAGAAGTEKSAENGDTAAPPKKKKKKVQNKAVKLDDAVVKEYEETLAKVGRVALFFLKKMTKGG